MNKEEIIEKLTLNVIDFEEGDILMLSDMFDDIILLKELLKDDKIENLQIIDDVISLLDDLLKGGVCENFSEFMTNHIDLINRLQNFTDDDVPTLLKEDINNKEVDKELVKLNKDDLDPDYDLSSETIKIFLSEAEERMSDAQRLILELEDDLRNREYIDDLFRVFHTIKGECGFLNLLKLGELTHNLENLLDRLRYNEIQNSHSIIDTILNCLDVTNNILKALKSEDFELYNSIDIIPSIRDIEEFTSDGKTPIGKVLESEGILTKKQVEDIVDKQKSSGYNKKFGEIAVEENILKEEIIDETLKAQKRSNVQKDAIIKVKASQINYLVDMIGELLIAENQLEDSNIVFLKKITKEIQHTAMMLRTIKIKNLLINMKRVIRDASKKLGKNINFEIEGENLEVDRTLVERLEEPLIHILRNSVGHGIETREERINRGKSEVGNITLKAERVGNQIIISVRDDGAGLDSKKILEKAISKKIISVEKAKQLKEHEIFSLIFYPGFSTAEVIDSVSGRGVGMDIVKTTVHALRGHIDIKSEKGLYSQFNLVFPLIMAIIDGMIVKVDDVNFILPVSSIIETLKFDPKNIHSVENKESVVNLRKEIIPVINLRNYYDMHNTAQSIKELIIIVEHNKRKYALVVDEIVAKKEVVIKSLGDKFKKLQGISAATILSGGKIGFIINIDEIVSVKLESIIDKV